MSENTKISTTKRVTKSIRLTRDEARELADLVGETAYSEAALMRQWVLSGMQEFRVRESIRAYQEGHVDLRLAAEQAQLPVAIFLEEMAAHRVAVLDHPEAFGAGIEALRAAFGNGVGVVDHR